MNHTPTVNFSDFEDDGICQAVYFILDQSRDLPAFRRANIMMQASGMFPVNSDARRELHALAGELFTLETAVKEMVGILRFCNPTVVTNEAISFMLFRIEVADIRTQLDFVSTAANLGIKTGGAALRSKLFSLWEVSEAAAECFYHSLDSFMFRLRNRLLDPAAPAAKEPAA